MGRYVEVNGVMEEQAGYARLSCWFGLGRYAFLTLPRVLMQDMPDEWQNKMAALLEEYEEAFPNQPEIDVSVVARKNGKFTRLPDFICNYRHPDTAAIDFMRSTDGSS